MSDESDTLSESAACALLARLFRGRGYAIRRDVRFEENGVSFDIDGWDAKARVGFEFLSSEQEDHDDLTLREFEALKAAEQRRELAVFVIDEVESLSAADLTAEARSFLSEVAARPPLRRRPTKPAAKKPAAKKSAAKKSAAKKPASTKPSTRARRRGR
jgi:hypothetical protein